MKKQKLKIGVTACGGNMVSSALLSLKRSQHIDFEIYAFNSAQHEISQNIADHFALLPEGSTPEYVDTVLRFIKKFNLDVFMPWSDEEAQALSVCRDEVTENGCVPLVSSPETINLIRDKAATYDKLKAAGLDVPECTVVSNCLNSSPLMEVLWLSRKISCHKTSNRSRWKGCKSACWQTRKRLDWHWPYEKNAVKNLSLSSHHQTRSTYLVMPCLDALFIC